MNARTAAATALLASMAHRAFTYAMRFLRNQPATEHERRVFVHLNGLVEAVTNQALNRTFAPHLKVVN